MEYYDFEAKMMELLTACDGKVNIDAVMNNKALISNIAQEARQTKLFQKEIMNYEVFLDELKSIPNEEGRILGCLSILIDKMDDAPTQKSLIATIILLTPMLDDVIKSINPQKEELCLN